MKLVLSLLALLYFILPHDLFPDVVLGWGWLDDLVVFYLLWRFFYRIKGRPFGFTQREAGREQSSGQSQGEKRSTDNEKSSSAQRLKDPYEVLQVSRDASLQEIRAAYKDLAGKYHPDKVLHLGEEFQALAEERFKEIQEAYQMLVDRR